MLSQSQAKRIITDISQILSCDVVYIDQTGKIKASSNDLTIINHIHPIGQKILDEKLDEFYVEDTTSNIIHQGLYLSLNLNDKIIGVLGIYDTREKINLYAQLVKKMLSFFLDELNNSVEKQDYRKKLQRFLESCLLEEWTHPSANLIELSHAVGVDISVPKRVIVVSIEPPFPLDQNETDLQKKHLRNIIRTLLPHCLDLWYADREILILDETNDERILQSAKNIKFYANKTYGLNLNIGISECHKNLHIAYKQADSAWQATILDADRICFYGDMAIARFVMEISTDVKIDYIKRIFSKCSYSELCSWIDFIRVYFKADGSLQKGSEMLYIHKNTFQYKIKKLYELTGCDIRRPSDVAILYMAMVFFTEIGSELSIIES